jgi:molecular chaperone HscC
MVRGRGHSYNRGFLHNGRQQMIVGIDLGTTHSLIGVHSSDGPRLFPNAHGELLTPSVVSLDGDVVLVGAPARDRLISHPSRPAHFKRWMGNRRPGWAIAYSVPRSSALVLRSLLADAEAVLGQKVEEAVISVPAYFPTPSARPPAPPASWLASGSSA